MAEDIPHRLSENDIASLKEWIASWGDKSNWLDPKGEMIPVSKKVLLDLIKDRDEWRRQAMEHGCKKEIQTTDKPVATYESERR